MKLSQTINDALVQQIGHEFQNMLVYKQFESFFEGLQLKNLANYFKNQAQHEKEHGDKFLEYVNDRVGGNVVLSTVPMPEMNLGNYVFLAEEYLKVEQRTTESIEEIFDLVLGEKSYIDLPFLQTMLAEQVEEEDQAEHFLMLIRNVKDIVIFDATWK